MQKYQCSLSLSLVGKEDAIVRSHMYCSLPLTLTEYHGFCSQEHYMQSNMGRDDQNGSGQQKRQNTFETLAQTLLSIAKCAKPESDPALVHLLEESHRYSDNFKPS